MADWVNDIFIDKIDAILKANYNTELNSVNSSLDTIPDTQIFKSRQPVVQKYPAIMQGLVGDSPFLDEGLLAHNQQVLWSHLTSIRIVDYHPEKSKGNELWYFVTALHKTIYKGITTAGKLDGNVCRIFPVAWVSNEVTDDNTNVLVKEGGVLWLIDQIYDPTS